MLKCFEVEMKIVRQDGTEFEHTLLVPISKGVKGAEEFALEWARVSNYLSAKVTGIVDRNALADFFPQR